MSVPGPPGGLWTLALLVWAIGALVVGEAVRGSVAKWVPLWRNPEPLERTLLDVYLGGAAVFLVAALEVGVFVPPVVYGLPVVAGGVVAYRALRSRRRGLLGDAAARISNGLLNRWALIALTSAFGLYLVEVAFALPVPTGNTYDSSLLTTYVALLLQHGSLPLSFRPYGSSALLYPQGATVWLGWAQLDFGLPPARTSLLVTPLFLGMTPLAGYVLGNRWVGSPKAGAAFAVALAWLGPSTRALVGGSNDFVFALPLVLLLVAEATVWASRSPPALGDAVGFGVLLGYSGALNVVGAEWLLPALVVLAVATTPRFGGRLLSWFGRWATAVGVALIAGLPSIAVLVRARGSPGSLAGTLSAPSGTSVGIGLSQLVGSIDPFLFRPGDIELSPIPYVRLELAVLLVVAAALAVGRIGAGAGLGPWSGFARMTVASGAAIVGWLVLELAAGMPGSRLRVLAFVSNTQEFSLALFTFYGLVAAVPLALAFERVGSGDAGRTTGTTTAPHRRRQGTARQLAPVIFAAVVVIPAVVLTPASLGPVLSDYYGDFGNVSAADFALFAYAEAHVAPGTRVLVAPGSAAEFLPGYARGIVLLYPMSPGWSRANASYTLVVQELTNGTLDAAGREALAALEVDLVVVTGNSTILWPAFWAFPLLEAQVNSTPTFPVVWHEQDAWVFNASGCRPGSTGCP